MRAIAAAGAIGCVASSRYNESDAAASGGDFDGGGRAGVKSGAARGDVLHLRDVVGCEDELAR